MSDQLAELREALTELVACEDLKAAEKAAREKHYQSGLTGDYREAREAKRLREEYERRQPLAWKRARAVLSRPQELADPAEPCIHEWVSSLRPDIVQGEWCHKCMTPRATQAEPSVRPQELADPAEPTKAQWNLDSEAAGLLAATIGLEDFAPIALAVMRSPDGHGLHVWLTDYPEEGSILLVESATPAEPTAQAQRDAGYLRQVAKSSLAGPVNRTVREIADRILATPAEPSVRPQEPALTVAETMSRIKVTRHVDGADQNLAALSSSATEPDRNAARELLLRMAPFIDSIVCYASTLDYDGNQLAKDYAEWLARSGG